MIYLEIQGNLGNQLFQYACARNIQEITGQKIVLNLSNTFRNRPDIHFGLDAYRLNDNIIIDKENNLPWYANSFFPITRVLKRLAPNLTFNIGSKFGVYIWQKPIYRNIILNNNIRNIYLSGFWQCDKYFSSIRSDLLEELTPKYEPIKKNANLYKEINETESVCLSIRRGDYVTNNKFRNIFFVCNKNYFDNALTQIKHDIPNCTLFVFSDDINWVKNNMTFNCPVYFEDGNDPTWEKLRMMSSCKHFILSNSSFSWWAQYLSENENKKVYAPEYWLVSKEKVDIYEEGWNLIGVDL